MLNSFLLGLRCASDCSLTPYFYPFQSHHGYVTTCRTADHTAIQPTITTPLPPLLPNRRKKRGGGGGAKTIWLTYRNICCGQIWETVSPSCLHVMCEVSLRDTVGEESLCAEMVADRTFIRPTEGPLLLFWDLSWVQSERAADRRVSSPHTHARTHTKRHKLHVHELTYKKKKN